MKKCEELFQFKEINSEEAKEIVGGNQLSDAIIYCLGFCYGRHIRSLSKFGDSVQWLA